MMPRERGMTWLKHLPASPPLFPHILLIKKPDDYRFISRHIFFLFFFSYFLFLGK